MFEMAIDDLNVASLLETKSNRAAPTESVPLSNERPNPDAAAVKWIKAALVGALATFAMFIIVSVGIGARKK
jgi:hypothetical protein